MEKNRGNRGIASGMSGSPVYIDGKLIGAIAYSWSLSDHRFGLITPIEDMLALLESTGQTGEKDSGVFLKYSLIYQWDAGQGLSENQEGI